MNALAWHMALAGRNLDEAATLEQRALRKDPTNSSFLDTSGMIFMKAGKLDEALGIFERLVTDHGNIPAYRTHLGEVLIQRGNRQRARTELEIALRNHPSSYEEEEIRRLLKNAS
jgi:predicted Zn-dependent protease